MDWVVSSLTGISSMSSTWLLPVLILAIVFLTCASVDISNRLRNQCWALVCTPDPVHKSEALDTYGNATKSGARTEEHVNCNKEESTWSMVYEEEATERPDQEETEEDIWGPMQSPISLADIPNQRSEEEGLKLVLAEAWSCLASYLNIPGHARPGIDQDLIFRACFVEGSFIAFQLCYGWITGSYGIGWLALLYPSMAGLCSTYLALCAHVYVTCWKPQAASSSGGTSLRMSGSTVAERTKWAMQLVGKTPLEEAAKDHPEDALRAYIKQNEKPYNDESPEFAEKLRIFKKTCEVVREKNAKTIAEGTKPHHGVNLMADTIEPGTWKGSERMDAWIEPGGWLYETRHQSMLGTRP